MFSSTVNHNNIVRLNVGGTRYDLSRDTLDRCKGSMLASLVSTRWTMGSLGDSEIIFIDRNGLLFQYVLDYLRNNKLHLPCSVSRAAVKDEFDYYGIRADMNKVIIRSASPIQERSQRPFKLCRKMYPWYEMVRTGLATRALHLAEYNEALLSKISSLSISLNLNTLAMGLGFYVTIFGGFKMVKILFEAEFRSGISRSHS